MSERIRVAYIREQPLDFLEGASEEDLFALIDVVEAAHETTVVMSRPPRGKFPHADRLRDALDRLDFGDDAVREGV